MKKKCKLLILFVLFLIALSLSGFADDVQENVTTIENFEVSLTLIDLTSNEIVQNVTLNYLINGISSSIFIDDSGLFKLSLPEGNYVIQIEAFDQLTPSADYYGEVKFSVNEDLSKQMYVYPIGLIRGFVKDSLDNIVPNAALKFECVAMVITEYPVETDQFGFFKVENAPVSSCKIITSYEDSIGMVEFDVTKGSLNDVTINLDKSLIKNNDYGVFNYLAVLLGILVVLVAIWYFNKNNRHIKPYTKSTKAMDKSQSGSKLKPKLAETVNINVSETILKTLNKKEKAVVEFLLANTNKASQAKIRHATGIPRTSLSRVLQSLEGKKIVHVEKHGKMVNVALTDFFLGKK